MPDSPALTIRSIASVGVEVPMNFALGTSRGRITKAPLLLIDVTTAEGITGRAYLWSYFPRAMVAIASILQEIEERTKGERVDPAVLWSKLAERFALIGVQGVVRMAMAGFDIACWDALAAAAGVPLVKFLGGEPRRVLAYNSCGLGFDADRCARRRSREAARERLSRHQTSTRLSDPRRGPCGRACRAEAYPGRVSR